MVVTGLLLGLIVIALQAPALGTPEEGDGSMMAQCLQTYTVQVGDTWDSIATDREVDVNVLALRNSMAVKDALAVGATICMLDLSPAQFAPATSTAANVYRDRLGTLVVAPHLQDIAYNRDDWRHWTDADGDCQNARAEALIEESLVPVTFRANNPCIVHSGLWIGPWGGDRHTLASELDMDHHVPLLNAHLSGGAWWSAGEKQVYANDLSLASALQATKNSLNRQKGARGPEAWKPPLRETWCVYAQDWVDVKHKYSLTLTMPEKAALQDMLSTCDATAIQSVAAAVPSRLPVPGEGGGSWYTIARGDSLGQIASLRECPLLVLVAVNQISNPNVIQVGDRLWIPTHCAALASALPALVPESTATPLPQSTPVSSPAPPPVPQTARQCTVHPYAPPSPPPKPHQSCKWFDDAGWTRADFDRHYGGSFHPSHDRDQDCIPCESLD